MVLLIEENPRELRILARQFDRDCVSTKDPRKAVSLASQYQPHGIVADADFVSPTSELIAALRVVAPSSPLIVLARESSDAQALALMRAGVAAYVDVRNIGIVGKLVRRITRRLARHAA